MVLLWHHLLQLQNPFVFLLSNANSLSSTEAPREFWEGRSLLSKLSAGVNNVRRFREGASGRCHTQYGRHLGGGG